MSVVGVVTAVTSTITGAVVSVLYSSSSLLPQEIMVRQKRNTNKMCKILFIFSPISNERRRFEELHFQNFTNRLSNQSDIIAHIRHNFMYVKTFTSDLDG